MELETDPENYNEAIQDKDVTLWQKAINTEMESMYSNQVWTLVDPAVGVKPIGCKWIYKRKRGIDGKVETFKAQLVAKGYTQKGRLQLRRDLLASSHDQIYQDSLSHCHSYGL